MIKVVFVIPYQKMEELVIKAWDEHGKYFADNVLMRSDEYEIEMFETVSQENFMKRKFDADVIVSRGATAMGLKSMNVDIPVVEMPVTTNDLLFAIGELRKKLPKERIGLIGSKNMVYMADLILDREQLGLDLYRYRHNSMEEIENCIDEAMSNGCKAVIGGMLTIKCCILRNMVYQRLDTSYESIWQSITEAKRAGRIFHEERRRAMRFKAIVDYAHEGILTLDNERKISLLNKKAAEILNIDGEASVGKKTEEVFPETKLGSMLQSGNEYDNNLVIDQKYKINLTKVHLMFGEEQIGEIATFQDVTSIIDAESTLRGKLRKRGHFVRYTFENIVGESQRIVSCIEKAKIYARADSNVMIYGPTGTGKELFAQAIHNHSQRTKEPFVAVNCAALPDNLLESELFGYVDGAFTGAARGGKQGLFELAHNGTLFLDEIAEIPLRLQGRLLRAIQEGEIMRLGDERVIPVNVRIFCATNKRLSELVNEGGFREDLYYRLNVLCIQIPALIEREKDVLQIMQFFLNENAKKSGKKPMTIEKEAEQSILKYHWPGNIRELKNICERLTALDKTGKITAEAMYNALPPESMQIKRKERDIFYQRPLNMRESEKEKIAEALKYTKNNKSEAARLLGISRATLWKKIGEYQLEE